MAPKRAQPPSTAAPSNKKTKTSARANKENLGTKASTPKAAAKRKNATRPANPAAMQIFTDVVAAAAATTPPVLAQHAGNAADTTVNNANIPPSSAATNSTINSGANAINLAANTVTNATHVDANATRAANGTSGASVPLIDPTLLAGDVEKLQQELRDAREALAAANAATANANAAAAAAAANAANAANAPAATAVVNAAADQPAEIFHPGTGCAGNGFNLQKEMGLQHDKKKYLAIRRQLKGIVNQSGLDFMDTWPKQSRIVIARVLLLARQKIPYLRRFHQDWATIEIMRSRFKNQRQYAGRLDDDDEEELAAAGTGDNALILGVGVGGGDA